MDMFGDFSGASALSGGLLGIAGNIAAKAIRYFETEQTARHRKAQREHDAVLGDMRAAKDCAPDLSVNATAAPSCAEPAAPAWVNAVRTLVRPVLTLGLAAFLVTAFFALPTGASDRSCVLNSLAFASVTAITWWFADRSPRQPAPH